MPPRGQDFFIDNTQLKSCLQSPDPELQIAAVKYVIANMTVGKDMSSHFSDVSRLVNSTNFELKKLVYLYLMQNAKSQPEKAVLHAGTFVRDSQHESPLIKGIALRTMTSMQIPAMTDFSNSVVLRCLGDPDPYVRRNATVAVVKLQHASPTSIVENGILGELIELIGDPVASVVAAAVCALCELMTARPESADVIRSAIVAQTTTLLNALTECHEWSQIYLLNGIALNFQPTASSPTFPPLADAEVHLSRVLPFLQSNNPAVTMASANTIINFLQCYCHQRSGLSPLQQADLDKKYAGKIAQPLVSLISGLRFEIRYAALRAIKLVMQKHKDALVPYISSFYVKFDDPIFIKLEKIDIMIALAVKSNADLILAELAEYATEVDVELVRKAVRCVGILAVKIAGIAPQCVERLVILIESRVNYVVQEAAVVVQNILRQYPNKYESIIPKLCSALDVLDDPESKCAVMWVVGEYADRIENCVEILNLFFENFVDEPVLVQMATLCATVKSYVAASNDNYESRKVALEKCLALATSSPAPDLRDRAYFYWRLIRADQQVAAKIVNAPKEKIVEGSAYDRALLLELCADLGRLSSVLHKPIALVMGDARRAPVAYDEADEAIDEEARQRAAAALEKDMVAGPSSSASASAGGGNVFAGVSDEAPASPSAVLPKMPELEVCLDPATKGKGLEVAMAWVPGTSLFPLLRVKARLTSECLAPQVSISMLQLNVNRFGIGLGQDFPSLVLHRAPSDESTVETMLLVNANNQKKAVTDIQVAIKADPLGVMFFTAPPIPPALVISPATGYDPPTYAREFQALANTWIMPEDQGPKVNTDGLTAAFFKAHGVNLINKNEKSPLIGLHLFATAINGVKMYVEVTVESGVVVLCNVRVEDVLMAEFYGQYILKVLSLA